MWIKNETQQPIFYSIVGGGGADCGTVEPGGTESLPGYDEGYSSLTLQPRDPSDYFQLTNGPEYAVVKLTLTAKTITAEERAELDKQSKK